MLNRFKGSNAAGGLDVNRIEEALAKAVASSSSLREPMPMVAMQQLFQLTLSLADRTLCERRSRLPLSALPTGARMPERLKFLNNNVESVLAALLIRRLAVPGFILVWGTYQDQLSRDHLVERTGGSSTNVHIDRIIAVKESTGTVPRNFPKVPSR